MKQNLPKKIRIWVPTLFILLGFLGSLSAVILFLLNAFNIIEYLELGKSFLGFAGFQIESPLSFGIFCMGLSIIGFASYKEEFLDNKNPIADENLVYNKNPIVNEKPIEDDFPMIDWSVDQIGIKLPNVRFIIRNVSPDFSVKAQTFVKIFLNNELVKDYAKKKDPDHHSGTKLWRLNPSAVATGYFQVPDEAIDSDKKLRVVIDAKRIALDGREQELLPKEYIYRREEKDWYSEP